MEAFIRLTMIVRAAIQCQRYCHPLFSSLRTILARVSIL